MTVTSPNDQNQVSLVLTGTIITPLAPSPWHFFTNPDSRNPWNADTTCGHSRMQNNPWDDRFGHESAFAYVFSAVTYYRSTTDSVWKQGPLKFGQGIKLGPKLFPGPIADHFILDLTYLDPPCRLRILRKFPLARWAGFLETMRARLPWRSLFLPCSRTGNRMRVSPGRPLDSCRVFTIT